MSHQVLQKLGKTMETKDEQFELCFQNLNKQQVRRALLQFQHKEVMQYAGYVVLPHFSLSDCKPSR